MHIGVTIGTIIIAWEWGDWKNWQKYHSTMIYIAMGSLLYYFLYCDHWLWQYKPGFLVTTVIADMLSTFIIFFWASDKKAVIISAYIAKKYAPLSAAGLLAGEHIYVQPFIDVYH